MAMYSGGAHLLLPQRNLRPFTGVTVSEERQLRVDTATGNLCASSPSRRISFSFSLEGAELIRHSGWGCGS